ncbi:MAG: glycosyltransferase family 2 protein [Acidobacteriota bacterium]
MKAIIQIPCFNEAESLPATLAELPRELPGCDLVEWLVIDDGSSDDTVAVARAHGVDHVVSLPRNQGLATAFRTGLRACIERGADVIVNTDADNQYCAADLPALVRPIVAGHADMVVGCRPIETIEHFSASKKLLQRLGSWVVRAASRADVDDAPSGFRALSRQAAMRLNIFSEYTYTLESLIQAGQKNMAVLSVPVRVNDPLRASRLIKSTGSYLLRSADTIVRIFMTYRPFRFFFVPGALSFLAGFVLGLRFVWYFLNGEGDGHVQSVILAALLLGLGIFLAVVGLLGDLIAVNRKLLEDTRWQLFEIQDALRAPPMDERTTRVQRAGSAPVSRRNASM